ncbi:glycosyltransferase [Oceanobacillus oncorhynchi subsp. oncorhynchi]|uniref:glycosyltransferase n=1 Tax=Oceanobacillus oncorhynchi TaxID=545501 RepID=UPI0036431633
MKLVFAHDHVFYKYKDEFYSTGGLSKQMIERYTYIFDEVIILSRQKEIKIFDNKLTLASTERVKFVHVPDFKSIKNFYKIYKARTIIKDEVSNSDAVIGRLPSSIGSMAINYANKLDIKSLIEVVACPWDALWNHSVKGKVIAPFEFIKMRKLVLKSKYTLYVTDSFLQERYPTKGESINCSNVSLPLIESSILEKRLKKIKNFSNQNKFIIGTIGGIDVKHKGQDSVIKAIGVLKRQGKLQNLEYQLVGGGGGEYLKKVAKENNVIEHIKFLGTMQHTEIFQWLDSIDLYIQPSKQEGLPRALIEAMSRAVPSLGAYTAGIPELLTRESIFSKKKNVKEIAILLDNLNEKQLTKESKINFTEAKKYNKEIINKRRIAFFKKFINQ